MLTFQLVETIIVLIFKSSANGEQTLGQLTSKNYYFHKYEQLMDLLFEGIHLCLGKVKLRILQIYFKCLHTVQLKQ